MTRMSVEERRSALVNAAYRVIADLGVEGATTRRICAQAGMPLASFHYAFESRTALLRAVIDTAVPYDLSRVLDAISPETNPEGIGVEHLRANMHENLETFYAMLRADPGRMQATISLGIYAHNHPELDDAGKIMYERLYKIAGDGLKVGAARAGMTFDVDVSDLAPLMIATTNAITLTYLSTADDKVVRQLITAVVNVMISHAQLL
ncbi:TetR family transcriptional regulator [Gordonia sp. TBRC 11910]|uniref:TetR family transcriptional regulator n=1 Tax=Gordonia asplenii TaxID=2725283 RepID=A0A848KZH7_9ACTN|nr:TetR family transcriptional regulator [Gordonia asplenii]NMO01591.1 TetR family transcriptional regulator [Gordonia asplenii]